MNPNKPNTNPNKPNFTPTRVQYAEVDSRIFVGAEKAYLPSAKKITSDTMLPAGRLFHAGRLITKTYFFRDDYLEKIDICLFCELVPHIKHFGTLIPALRKNKRP